MLVTSFYLEQGLLLLNLQLRENIKTNQALQEAYLENLKAYGEMMERLSRHWI